MEFNSFDLCSPELQQKLLPMRNKFKEIDDAAVLDKEKIKNKNDKVVEKKTKALPYCFEDGKSIHLRMFNINV